MQTSSISPSQASSLLFGRFPRYIGPRQCQVHSYPELLSHMSAQSGVTNCFTSVYSFIPKYTPIIDKLFLEADDEPAKALRAGQRLFEECTERYHFPTLPIWSGNRSPHIFPLFQPEVLPNPSDAIKKAAYKIVQTSNQYHIDPYSYKKIPYIDTRVLEARRLCRFPNTRRVSPSGIPSSNNCIILDPSRFLDMNIKEVQDLSQTPQTKNITFSSEPPSSKLSDIPVSDINLDEWAGNQVSSPTSLDPETEYYSSSRIQPTALEYMIESLITRPCNRLSLQSPNPSHRARISIVAELKHKGIEKSFIKYLFSCFNLYDYDQTTTSIQVDHIFSKNYLPFGRRIMQEESLCNPEPSNPNCIKCQSRKYT